jgi:hypothetical protein
MPRSFCKYCRAPILWATNHEKNSRVPLEPRPDNNLGKLLLDLGQMTVVELDAAMIQRAIENEFPLYVNHLTVCTELNSESRSRSDRELGNAA